MKNDSLVKRITIDEKLSEDYIRVLISPLRSNIKKFCDEEKEWMDEEEFLIDSKNYYNILEMTPSEKRKRSIIDFKEGQVFLSGKFKVIKKYPDEKYQITPSGRRNFRQIDRVVKKKIDNLYFKALQGGRDETKRN